MGRFHRRNAQSVREIASPPGCAAKRNRTIKDDDELIRVLTACIYHGHTRHKRQVPGASLFHVVFFAYLNAMCRAEVIRIRLKDIDFYAAASVVHFADTKQSAARSPAYGRSS
jgi:integrase